MEASKPKLNQSGIALFMVLAAISVLSILVTEFTYLSQINQKLAYDRLDRVKAEYLGKTIFKLSLLRLKAYKTLKGISGGKNSVTIPQKVLDQIWQFPFVYPIPSELPGIDAGQRDAIKKFQLESNLEGDATATITSESSRYNLNLLLPAYAAQPAAPAANGTPGNTGAGNPAPPQPTPAPTEFDPEKARKGLQDFLTNILSTKSLHDEAFAAEYRDFQVSELVKHIYGWVDSKYTDALNYRDQDNPARKGAAFYSLDELHMIPGMDDTLYDLFEPNLTTEPTSGVNVNTINKYVLKALLPLMTEDDVKAFFEFRDSKAEDNTFKTIDDFYKYLQSNVSAYQADQQVADLKTELADRNIALVTDEKVFLVEVRATVNTAVVLIRAKVHTSDPPQQAPTPGGQPAPGGQPDSKRGKDPGLKITYFRMV